MGLLSWTKQGNWSAGETLLSGKNIMQMGGTGTRYGASLVITGWENLRANLLQLAVLYPQEMGMALREEAMAIMEDSQRICPVDKDNFHEDGTPHLADTADVQGPYIEGDSITVTMSYDTPYAVIQHETLEYQHDYPEQWKYLESPMMARAKFMASNLVKAVNLERLNVGYNATPTGTLMENMMIANRQRAAINKYGHLLGRFV